MKKCSHCQETLRIDLFGKCRSRKDGLNDRCKSCVKKFNKLRSKEMMKQSGYKSRFSRSLITEQEYEYRYRRQNGLCAICEKVNTDGRRFNVDHSHVTGKVRGLLCRRCNLVLGSVKDDIQLLHKAVDYLDKHENHVHLP